MAKYKLSKLISLFKRFGGVRLFRAYARLGVLGAALGAWVKGVLKREPADEVFYSYEAKIITALQTRYKLLMEKSLSKYEADQAPQERSSIVWFCWLQGIESAPPIVKACYKALQENLDGKEIRVVDDNNRKELVQLPDYIERRHDKGQIPHAMFSDLLRLELLIKFGGSWIDATVFCSTPDYPRAYLDADIFFFQYARPDERKYAGISNWFITACSNNPLLMTLRDMLYAYWQDFDCVVEYFIFHRFFDMIAEARPEEVAQIPYAYSPNAHVLLRHWAEPFDQAKWDKVTTRVSFHKLAHQVTDEVRNDVLNYYNHIVLGIQ